MRQSSVSQPSLIWIWGHEVTEHRHTRDRKQARGILAFVRWTSLVAGILFKDMASYRTCSELREDIEETLYHKLLAFYTLHIKFHNPFR